MFRDEFESLEAYHKYIHSLETFLIDDRVELHEHWIVDDPHTPDENGLVYPYYQGCRSYSRPMFEIEPIVCRENGSCLTCEPREWFWEELEEARQRYAQAAWRSSIYDPPPFDPEVPAKEPHP